MSGAHARLCFLSEVHFQRGNKNHRDAKVRKDDGANSLMPFAVWGDVCRVSVSKTVEQPVKSLLILGVFFPMTVVPPCFY